MNRTTTMRLEMQLISAPVWHKLAAAAAAAAEEEEEDCHPLLRLVTRGSTKLDSILLRSTCPYLYCLATQPIFHSAAARLQPDSPLLHALDENLLGQIFSFLTERELCVSISRTCTLFRASLVSKVHLAVLLGRVLSTPLAKAINPPSSTTPTTIEDESTLLADRLEELAGTMRAAYLQLAAAAAVNHDDDPAAALTQRGVAHVMQHQFIRRVPDCPARLQDLALALVGRHRLQEHASEVGAVLSACEQLSCPTSTANVVLRQLLAVGLALGEHYGQQQQHQQSQHSSQEMPAATQVAAAAFHLSSLTSLHDRKSRFHRKFTLAELVLLMMVESEDDAEGGGDKEQQLAELHAALLALTGGLTRPSVADTLNAAASFASKITARAAAAAPLSAADTKDTFPSRMHGLFRLLTADAHAVTANVLRARELVADVTQVYFGGPAAAARDELAALRNFVKYCLDRLAQARLDEGESSAAYCELAWKAVALESSAVAKNALHQPRVQQPDHEKSSDFLLARNLVREASSGGGGNGFNALAGEVARSAREQRMQQVAEETAGASAGVAMNGAALLLGARLQFRAPLPAEEEQDGKVVEEAPAPEPLPLPPPAMPATLALWEWSPFSVVCAAEGDGRRRSVWQELTPRALSPTDVRTISKLFSRGPEVHLTVVAAHQRLRHFTGEDFTNTRRAPSSSSSSTAGSAIVDVKQTTRALDALRQQEGAPSPASTSPPRAPPRPEHHHHQDVAAGRGVVLPLARILELKQQGKLATVQLQPQQLELYLSREEFELVFSMKQEDFAALPAWKRDKCKKLCGLF